MLFQSFIGNYNMFTNKKIDFCLKFFINLIFMLLFFKKLSYYYSSNLILPLGYVYMLLLIFLVFEILVLSGLQIINDISKIFFREIFIVSLLIVIFLSLDFSYNLIITSNSFLSITYLWTWINILPNFLVDFKLFQSGIFIIASFLVVTTSLFILSFSLEYISIFEIIKFCCFLLFFAIFMLLNILSSDWILMFFGWEGIGLMSFFLISFWRHRHEANKSAVKAFFVNKIGDSIIILIISFFLFYFQNSEFEVQFAIWFNPNSDLIFFIVLLFFISVLGKSAQFLFHFWLDDAMEGPTPVSALIHAATLVTAGVFLILKNQSIFLYSYYNFLFLIIGLLSSISGIISSLEQDDFKKIIAYTTLTNIGIVFIFIGLGFIYLSFIHLIIHGFYKALTFLTLGNFIHLTSGEQTNKFKGISIKHIILDYFFIFISSLMMLGFPFLGAFFSKEILFYLNNYSSNFFFIVLLLSIWIFGILSNFSLIASFFYSTPSRNAKTNLYEFHRPALFLDIILLGLILINIFIPFVLIDFSLYFSDTYILYLVNNNTKEVSSNFLFSNIFWITAINSIEFNLFQTTGFFLTPFLIFAKFKKSNFLVNNYNNIGDYIISGFVNLFSMITSNISKFSFLIFTVNEYIILEYIFFFCKKIYYINLKFFIKFIWNNKLIESSSMSLVFLVSAYIYIIFITVF